MDKYKNNKTNKITVIISDRAAGMCEKTIGLTLVVYKYEGDNYEYPFVMEDREFYKKHTKMD